MQTSLRETATVRPASRRGTGMQCRRTAARRAAHASCCTAYSLIGSRKCRQTHLHGIRLRSLHLRAPFVRHRTATPLSAPLAPLPAAPLGVWDRALRARIAAAMRSAMPSSAQRPTRAPRLARGARTVAFLNLGGLFGGVAAAKPTLADRKVEVRAGQRAAGRVALTRARQLCVRCARCVASVGADDQPIACSDLQWRRP